MDYGALLSRAWTIVWEHKYLIALGVPAALSGGGSTTPNVSYQMSGDRRQGMPGAPTWEQFQPWTSVVSVAVLALICLLLLSGLVLWALSLIARGSLIAGVAQVDSGRETGLGLAWRAGWQRAGTLIGIGLVPLIPAFVLILISLLAGGCSIA